MGYSFEQTKDKLNVLNDKVIGVRHDICRFNNIDYKSIDCRMICFSSIQDTLYAATHIYYMQNCVRDNPVESVRLRSTLERVPIELMDDFVSNNLKSMLLLQTCFAIDFTLSDILRHLGKTPNSRVAVNFKTFTSMLKLSETKKKYFCEVIETLSYMRNINHNNGIHRNKSSQVIIGSKSFVFEKGVIPKNHNISRIITLIDEIIDILKTVFTTELVDDSISLKVLIPESFNEQEMNGF